MAGCRTVLVPTDACYQLRPDAIRAAITDRTAPSSPFRQQLERRGLFRTALREVEGLCHDRGLYHVGDGATDTTLDRRGMSAGSPRIRLHTFDLYCRKRGFAGWRIGYVVYPEHLASAMMKSQDTILISAPMISQLAAVAALDVGRSYCEPYVRELAEIRQIVLGALGTLAPLAEVPPADGAFYCFLKVNVPDKFNGGEGTASPAMVLAERLIREHQVAVIPGPAFGMTEGCYFRVAYGALQRETVAEGIGRLVKGLRAILS